jgi:hypothetical protein
VIFCQFRAQSASLMKSLRTNGIMAAKTQRGPTSIQTQLQMEGAATYPTAGSLNGWSMAIK